MDGRHDKRVQKTREQIRAAAHRLFLEHGFLGTSTDAIMAEAGISSKETLYRHYPSKEDMFFDVLSHLALERDSAAELSKLAAPHDLESLQDSLTVIAREILSIMVQPEYLAMLRIILTEIPRFPQLGPLFRTTVPERGLAIFGTLLTQAKEQNFIADVDSAVVAHTLLGGLLTYALLDSVLAGGTPQALSLDRPDAVVEVIMRALKP